MAWWLADKAKSASAQATYPLIAQLLLQALDLPTQLSRFDLQAVP